MGGKFPIGIYYLNRFLQASIISMDSYRHLLSQWIPTGIYVAFIQAFGLSPSLRFGDASIFFNEIFFCRHGLAFSPNRVA